MNVLRLLALIVFLGASIVAAPPAGADRAEQWREKLQEAEDLLMAGDYDKARRITVKITEQMVDEMGPGEQAAKALGAVLTLRALAEAGLGNEDDALWYWHVALNFFPEIGGHDLARFGAPGELLRGHPLPKRSPSEDCDQPPEDGSSCCPDCEGREVTPPKPRKKRQPDYPRGARFFGQQGTLVVQVVIARDGSVNEPTILKALPAPTMSFTALEAVRKWEFEPARLDGEPVAVYYNLTTSFSLRR